MQEQPRVLPHDNTEAFSSLGLQDYKHNNSPTPDQLQELRILTSSGKKSRVGLGTHKISEFESHKYRTGAYRISV